MRLATLPLITLTAALAACGSPEPEPAPTPTMTADTGPRTLVASKMMDLQLGPKIEGPQGTEVTTVLTADDGTTLGQMVSYVACPPGETTNGQPVPPTENAICDPANMPEGTIYTYVHTIGLGRPDMEAPDPAASPPQTMVFRMTRPAHGFNNVVGFDGQLASQTLGEDGEIKVQVEDDSLVWRVVAGNGWQDGENLTFFWQTTQPPAGPADAYQLRIDDATATATGPFPGAPDNTGDDGASN